MNGGTKDDKNDDQQKRYLEGLKKYKDRGIRIYIDDEECPETEWNKIFRVEEDGSFYMGDYVSNESGQLLEIRFDRIYHK